MSASREKKKRQEERLDQQNNPKKARNKAGVDRLRRGIIIAVASLLIIAVAVLAVLGSGLPQQKITALTIDGVDISVAEYNFNYFSGLNNMVQNYGSYFGWDESTDFSKEEWTEGMTVADYFHDQTVTSLKSTIAQSELARSKGLTLSDIDKESMEATIKSYVDAASSYGQSTRDFLFEHYGYGVDENVLRAAIERIYMATAWQTDTSKAFTSEEIEARYSANKQSYDWISYHSYTISGAYSGDLEGDEKTKAEEDAKADAKNKAEDMLSRVTTPEEFNALSKEFAPAPAEGEEEDAGGEETGDSTLHEKAASSSITSANLSAYLYDEARVNGDKTVIEDGTDYTVVLFLGRGRDESKLVSVRHILILSAEDYANATDEQKSAAHARCGELLEQWNTNGGGEDEFAALASQYTEDTASAVSGGLYENISNSGWEQAFADWSFDPARQPGDTGVVDTSYGSHAMYFIGYGEEAWRSAARGDLLSAGSSALLDTVAVTENSFGMSMSRTTKAKS